MSMNAPGECRSQDAKEPSRGAVKCRIPQRLAPAKARQNSNNSNTKTRLSNNLLESSKQKYEVTAAVNSRPCVKNSIRPRSGEYSRPKSANKLKEDIVRQPMRSIKSSERAPVSPKRQPIITRKEIRDTPPLNKSGTTPYIVVPVGQRSLVRTSCRSPTYLPNQDDSITKHETLELLRSELCVSVPTCNDNYETESITSQSDKIMQLKISWQEKMVQFEHMKNDLKDRQKGILELYALIRDTHQEMLLMGEKTSLPASDDLKIMNVGKLTPEQLLQLCAGDIDHNATLCNKKCIEDQTPLTIDMNKLYEMPSKLVDICEQTLIKRKEIIDWFQTLRNNAKSIHTHVLSKKINEFNDENDMLKCTLEKVKTEFNKELEDIVSLMRNGMNRTMALHLRAEELTYELSELNSQKDALKKQIQNAEHLRSHANKARVEELERDLKEERCKRLFLRDRLSRTEGQVKINIERASQLEAALEQARSQTRSLERTVQQLHEQNQKLQNDFDKELTKLTESIKEHTVHLEEIAEAREKLQSEKEDLEKKLSELSLYYKESLRNLKQELSLKIAQLMETEKKYEAESDYKRQLEEKLDNLSSQLMEAELHHKGAIQVIHEKDAQLAKANEVEKELRDTKKELESANAEIEINRNQLVKQTEELMELQRTLNDATNMEKVLKRDISMKEEYINELERKQSSLEQQLRENENKMESYVEQLKSLKTHINQLQEDFGDFENLKELQEMVNEQKAKLLEATRQNGELVEALQKKDDELERYVANISDNEQLLLEREGAINILSEKELEQTNIIKILRNNLELRSQAENDLAQQLAEKNVEIDSLVVNIETKKQQISNLEKIILTLEDQTRKASAQKKKDQEHISVLQDKIAEYEALHMKASRSETPAENLDSLIKILEDELGTSMEHEFKTKDQGYQAIKAKKKYHDKLEYHDDVFSTSRHHSDPDSYTTKIQMGNIVKRAYIRSQEEHIGDNLDRKKAIMNMEKQKRILGHEPSLNSYAPPQPPPLEENYPQFRRLSPGIQSPIKFTRNILSPEQLRDDKQHKMFKWAGHRL